MKLGTEYLSFNDAGHRLANMRIPEWCDWPPPEQLLVVCLSGSPDGPLTEIIACVPKSERDAITATAMFFEGTVQVFKQVSCSAIDDDDAQDLSHVARGALYVPESEDWDGRT